MNDLRDQTLRWEPDSHRPEIQIATWHSLEITETVEHLGTDSHLGLSPEETARTMAISAVVGAEMFYLFNSRYIFRPVLSREGLMGNHYVLIAVAVCAALQLAYVYTTPLQQVFGPTDLAAGEWMRVVLAGALVFTFAELEKVVMRNFKLVSFSRGQYCAVMRRCHMNAIRSLLAATDFSDHARNGLARAACIAAEQQAALVLLHVMSGPSLRSLRDLLDQSADVEAKLIAEAKRTLDQVATDIAGEHRAPVTSRVEIGAVLTEILTVAEQTDLLVMGGARHEPNPRPDLRFYSRAPVG